METTSSKKTVLRDLFYTIRANVLSMVISVVLFLIVPKFVSDTGYAHWQLFNLYITYAVYLSFGVGEGAYLRYGGYDDADLPRDKISSQYIILNISSLLILLLAVLVLPFFNIARYRYILLVATAIAALFMVPRSLLTYLLQATGRLKENAAVVIIERVVYIVVVIAALVLGFNSYIYLLAGAIVGKLVATIYALKICRENVFTRPVSPRAALSELADNLSAGVPLLLANLASVSIVGFIRLIVDGRWGINVFGKVSFSLSVLNMFLLFMNAVGTVLYPMLRRRSSQSNRDLYLPLHQLLTVALFLLLILFFPARWILSLWLPKYTVSFYYLAILFPMIVYECRNALLNYTYLKSMRKERVLFVINVGAALLSLGIGLIFAYTYSNLLLTIALMPVIVFIKTRLLERFILKQYGFTLIRESIAELLLMVLFVYVALAMKPLPGIGIYLVGVLLYLAINARGLKQHFSALRDIIHH